MAIFLTLWLRTRSSESCSGGCWTGIRRGTGRRTGRSRSRWRSRGSGEEISHQTRGVSHESDILPCGFVSGCEEIESFLVGHHTKTKLLVDDDYIISDIQILVNL